MIPRDNSIYIGKNVIDFGVKLGLSRDLLGFYRMSVLGVMKNCRLCQENIEILVW